ncbi:hypothetical protein EF917_21715 [Streptomyces sp. WAC00469]|nr:hypothetical protein EF917_21715 [Streptomyces sp. WAC00469]
MAVSNVRRADDTEDRSPCGAGELAVQGDGSERLGSRESHGGSTVRNAPARAGPGGGRSKGRPGARPGTPGGDDGERSAARRPVRPAPSGAPDVARPTANGLGNWTKRSLRLMIRHGGARVSGIRQLWRCV